MSWLLRRIVNEKNVGYLLDIVRPKMQEEVNEMVSEAVTDLLLDEEFYQMLNPVLDAYYERYKRKIFGTIGGLQKGLNTQLGGGNGGDIPDLFNEEGQLSIRKLLPFAMKSGILRNILGGKGAQNNPLSVKGGREAPG